MDSREELRSIVGHISRIMPCVRDIAANERPLCVDCADTEQERDWYYDLSKVLRSYKKNPQGPFGHVSDE